MVALLQRAYVYAGSLVSWHDPKPQEDTTGDLTADQIVYLHEIADERRLAWKEHARGVAR